MAAWRPELTTLDQVLNFYENSPLVRYKVYAGNKPEINALRWEFEGTDKNEGLHELRTACEAILANPSNINSYTLQLLRSDKVIKLGEHKAAKRIDDAINIVFQLNGVENYQRLPQPMQIGGVDNQLTHLIKQQTESINALTSLITASMGAANENPVDPEDQPMSVTERLIEPVIGLFQNPTLQNALAEKICGWLMGGKQPAAIAGTTLTDENEQLINQAITILKQYDQTLGSDLMKLAQIAQQDANNFNMLLTVLRNQ